MKATEGDVLYIDDFIKTKNNIVAYRITLIAVNSLKALAIMVLVTLLSLLFRYIGINESNIIVAYILGVLLVAKFTDGYFYGIFASVLGVLTFNFLFTEPYYNLSTYRPDYPITFSIMLVAAIITSTLTAKVKEAARGSFIREKRAQILYQISKSLLKARNLDQIAEISITNVARLFNRSVIITMVNSLGTLEEPHIYPFNNDKRISIFKSFNEEQAISMSFKTGKPVGVGTDKCFDSVAFYLPIKGQSGTLGVIGISCYDDRLLSDEQKVLLEAVITQIALAIEKELLSEQQQKSKIEVESERLKGNLLRATSHDLRTPLTGIMGSTATILENYDVLDKEVKIKLLQGVYEDASWLIHSVENILNITRIDEGRVEIEKSMEAVEEIVAEAVSRVKKLAENHIIKIDIPENLIMLPMNGTLIEQVIVNILDNAIRYTPFGSTIEIKSWNKDDTVIFEVSDNGKGITQENQSLVFDRFFSAGASNKTGRRGTGLGLAICKSIITAHGGEILVFNNSSGGATFRFELPARSDVNE